MPVAAVSDLIVAAPLAFALGVGVGLLMASRWLIVRRHDRRPPP